MQTVRRYANRKFYHLQGHRYITLEGIATLVRSGEPVSIFDHATGREITTEVLAQIVVQELPADDAAIRGPLKSAFHALIQVGRLPLDELVRLLVVAAGLPTRSDWQRLEHRVSQLESAVQRLFDAERSGVL
ncbi:MAG: polyhydroxyalkanoate synthesis regulator DNA-binding domain-containing protein [Chloroflexia bacterium]